MKYYCNGLTECPITVFPFVRRQHAQFSWKQACASSCLQIEHIQGCVVTAVVIFFCCFDFASTYNHSATSGTPIMKKTIIVRKASDEKCWIVENVNYGRFLFPLRRFDSATPFRVLDRITNTKRTENLDLITNAEITQTIIDLKTVGAVLNNKIVLNGEYEVGIIDDEISIKIAEREVLKKVVSENTQKAS